VKTSLADRIRWVLAHFGLQQQQLAEAMGVKLDRVKTLVLGRAKKLRQDELVQLQANYGLSRDWLVSEQGQPLPGVAYRPGPAGPAPAPHAGAPPGDMALLATESARGKYRPVPTPGDAQLLQRVVDATAAALGARGLVLPPERRLRLYWAVFELSLPAGEVNLAAIGPLLTLAEVPK